MTRGTARRSRQRPRVPTWTLAVISLLIVGAVLVLGYLAGRSGSGGADEVPFAAMAAGDCLDIRVEGVPPDRLANDEAVRAAVIQGDARRVPCTGPHSHEVAETTGFEIGDAYPGDDFLIAIARPACESGFARYIGQALDGSAIGLVIVPPDLGGWEDGQRRAVCLVRRNDGRYATGHLRGSGS